jgi:hypothetical protein
VEHVLEAQADRVAQRTLGAPSGTVNVSTVSLNGSAGQADYEPVGASVAQVIGSSGRALDRQTRSEFEARFGHSFANVRVHSDAHAAESARAMGAAAYTVGPHIVFGAGQYAPTRAPGAFLLAHELAHTLQQSKVAGFIQRRRVPPGSALTTTVTPGATDLAAHQAGLLRILRRAWDSLTPGEKTTVRTAAAAFGITGGTDAALFAALATATPTQLRSFADAIRTARPGLVLGDPALIDVGARPATSDTANITKLVTNANKIFDAVAAGSRDADLTAIFGSANLAAAKTKYAAARTRMNALHTADKIVTDRSGYSAEVSLGGLTNSAQIAVSPHTIDHPDAHDSVATLVHESMHAGNSDVHDKGYPDDPAFTRLDAATKLTNAAHFEVVAWRMLEKTNHDAFDGQTFIPAGTSVGGVSVPALTHREQAMRNTKEAFRGAWTAGLNLHKLWVRVFRNPAEWATLDLSTAFSGAAAGAHFSETMPFWSKVEMLTVHQRPGINPAGGAAEKPVTMIDIGLSEGLIRKLAAGMFGVPATEAATKALELAHATAAERTAAAAGVAAETSLLKKLMVRINTGEMTGPVARDVKVVDRMAAANAATNFTDLLAKRPPSAFPF